MRSEDREIPLPGLEVACRPIGFFFTELEGQGHSPDLLLDGVPYSRDQLTDKHGRIDWDSFRRLLANLGRVWDEEAFIRAGEALTTSRWMQPFGSIARLLLSCEELYRWTMHARTGVSRQQLTCVDNDLRRSGHRQLEIRTTMAPGYEPSPELLQIFVGALTKMPALLGLPLAKVEMRRTERGADYTVELPAEGRLFTKIRRLLAWPFYARIAARELKEISEQLFQRQTELLRESSSRASAEAALEESQNRFYKAFRAAPALMSISTPEGRILDLNDSMAEACGYSREEIIGRNVLEFGFWADPRLRDRMIAQLRSGDSPRAVETEFRSRGGEIRSGLVSAELITLQGERCVIFQGVDITDRKRAEEENRKLLERMLHAQKLESLGVMAGGIAHDFNNILVGILGNAEIALSELGGGKTRTRIEEIRTASKRAADLIREMLDYAGKGKFQAAPVDLAESVRETVRLVSSGLTAKLRVVLHLGDEEVWVSGDETQLRQVVMNLITNAAEAYGGEGGVVDVRVARSELDEDWHSEPCVGTAPGFGEHALIEVRDSGIGMDRDTVNRIFDPFFTTKFAGRGLGLAATLGIVQGHGGALRVDSAPGEGTSFQMVLPLCSRPATHPRPAAAVATVPVEGSILVVDDEKGVRDVMSTMLELSGYRATCANDGAEAIELVRRSPNAFAAVVLDLTMPELSGEETFQRLRRIRDDLPVICCSGYGDEVGVEWTEGRSHVEFVAKPFTRESILKGLSEVLSKTGSATESMDG